MIHPENAFFLLVGNIQKRHTFKGRIYTAMYRQEEPERPAANSRIGHPIASIFRKKIASHQENDVDNPPDAQTTEG